MAHYACSSRLQMLLDKKTTAEEALHLVDVFQLVGLDPRHGLWQRCASVIHCFSCGSHKLYAIML